MSFDDSRSTIHAMRRLQDLSSVLGLVLLAAAALFIWHFAQLPLQPGHLVTARVSAITARGGRLYANRDDVFLRNARGFGQFTLPEAQDHCRVGDEVQVLQRGTALTPLPTTCRR